MTDQAKINKDWASRTLAELNIIILLTRNLRFDADLRQLRHPLLLPLHYLRAKSNNRRQGQFECECDVTWSCFCFDFVCLQGQCGFCSIVCFCF